MRGVTHEEPDVDVSALVAGAREHDVAEAGRDRGAEGRERGGGGSVVIVAFGVEGCVAGRVAGRGDVFGHARGREDSDGFRERGLWVKGWVEGEVGSGWGGAGVERAVEAGEVLHAVFAGDFQECQDRGRG